MPLPYVYKVTKYDPTHWNKGRYVGPEDETSDHGPKEAAYLAAVTAFAEDSGVTEVSIREPEVTGFVNFGLEAPIDGHGLAGLFAPDLSDYHDGAVVRVDTAVELVRAMLRDNGAWCRLEAEDRFAVHIGYDQYMYIGSHLPCERAVATATGLGLFPIRIEQSPYDVDEEPGPPADAAFWEQLADLVTRHGTILLCESPARSLTRWHRLTAEDLDLTAGSVDRAAEDHELTAESVDRAADVLDRDVKRRQIRPYDLHLAPRARLSVWPDLSPDVEGVRATIDGLSEYVWENQAGEIQSVVVPDADVEGFPEDAIAAAVLPTTQDGYNPLLAGVLPDPDGVLRARWSLDG